MTNTTDYELYKLANDITKKLKNTPNESYLKTYKDSLNVITDKEIRLKVENYIENIIYSNTPSNIVVLIHGIRTYAEWQELLKDELDSYNDVKTYPIGYGYHDALRFWMPYIFRQTPINKITQKLRNIQSDHPTDNIIVIAHSNGTYVVSKILENAPDVKIHKLILCGSIINNSFRWDKIANRPCGGIINDCGLKDIWPILAKSLSWEYGSSGRFGFKTSEVTDRYHNFGHSDFFTMDFMKEFWIPFVIHNNQVPSNRTIKKTPYLLTVLDNIHFPTCFIILIPIFCWNSLAKIIKNIITLINF